MRPLLKLIYLTSKGSNLNKFHLLLISAPLFTSIALPVFIICIINMQLDKRDVKYIHNSNSNFLFFVRFKFFFWFCVYLFCFCQTCHSNKNYKPCPAFVRPFREVLGPFHHTSIEYYS